MQLKYQAQVILIKSKNYYDQAFLHGALEEDELIRIVFEKNTGYIECQSQELYKELRLLQGVSQYDIENNTSVFWDYCTLLEKDNP